MASKVGIPMTGVTGPVGQKLEECVIVYNPAETDSDKISTKLSGIIAELSTAAAGVAAKVTKVALTSTSEEKQLAKKAYSRTSKGRGVRGTVFIITEDILLGSERSFLDDMIQTASSSSDNPMIVTVYYKVVAVQIPQVLRLNDMLDYEKADFKPELIKVLNEWMAAPGPEMSKEVPDPMSYRVGCALMVEVHPVKGSSKNNKNKTADLRNIRESIYLILTDPSNTLTQKLQDLCTLIVRDVSQNPLKVISKVKDEDAWLKLQAACDDRSLGSLFMQHVLAHLQKELAYEIKVIAQRDEDFTAAPNPVDSIVANVIFDMIKKKEYTTYDFYQKLLSFRDKMDLRAIRSDPDGYNPMHAIIVYNRLPLILPLVQLKLFTAYLPDTVPISSPSSFRGHTPRQIAESKKARRFKEALVEHERLVHSMGKFLRACHDQDVALVRRMIHSQKQLLQEKDSFKNNCLYWALVSNNLDLFLLLLDNKADHNNVNESKESLLHVACMLGHHKFIATLLSPRCQLDVSAACSNKRTPLERVAENGDLECLKELLKHGVFLTTCVLPYAAANGRLPFIKYVLEETKQNVHVDSRDNTGRSAMMKACETGRREVVDYLLAKGASVNVEDLRHRTPLHVACENGHTDIVKILLGREARLNVQDCYTGAELCFLIRGKDKGRKAWHYVEVRRNVVHIFLQKTRAGQVDVAVYGTVVKSGWGEDPEKAIVEWVEKMFSDRRSSPSAAPDLTPLHMAIYKQHPDVARALIEKGADVNVKDHFGLTPFMLCALRNDKDTAVLLEEKGAQVHQKDKESNTALAIAEMNDQSEMVNYIKGKSYFMQAEQYMNGPLASGMKALDKVHLEGLRAGGADVRRHIIDAVRELTTANNMFLMDLGSGPIMKASSGVEDHSQLGAVGGGGGGGAQSMIAASVAESGYGSRQVEASSMPVRVSDPSVDPSGNPSGDINSVMGQTFNSNSNSSYGQETRGQNTQVPMELEDGTTAAASTQLQNPPDPHF